MSKLTLATAWLDGCSGCHMSFLDMDERLVELAQQIEIVHSPLVDTKTLPKQVDIGILEGAISTEDDLKHAREFRKHCKLLISLGDCAVNGNVPAMRNPFGLDAVLARGYLERPTDHSPPLIRTQPHQRQVTRESSARPSGEPTPVIPSQGVPALLDTVRPIHAEVAVDVFIPGCPPSADTIYRVLSDLIEGRTPDINAITRFGA